MIKYSLPNTYAALAKQKHPFPYDIHFTPPRRETHENTRLIHEIWRADVFRNKHFIVRQVSKRDC